MHMDDDGSGFKETHYIIKSFPYMVDGTPLVLLRLLRTNVDEESDLPASHNFLLTLDQVEVLQADLEMAKLSSINEFIKERAMLRELKEDIEEWENPEEPPADE